MTPRTDIEAEIRVKAQALGFDAVGFARAELPPSAGARLAELVSAGHHGEMGWMAERMAQRADPRGLWPEVRSVISLGMSYAPEGDALATLGHKTAGNISVYARNRDYHDIIKGKLKHLAQFVLSRAGERTPQVKVFVDTAPVMEKPLAQQAGLGWQGKHTNLVSRKHGSWLFLGEIYTTLDLSPDSSHDDRCGSCRRCIDACPTEAITAPYTLQPTRCISYLTIEHKGPIPEEFREALGNRIYGCDDCLAVCPWNRFAQAGREAKLAARADLEAPALRDLSRLDDAGFRARFAGSPVKRIGRDRFLRNVAIAIGNSGDPALLPEVERLAKDPDAILAEAAAWAAVRLRTMPKLLPGVDEAGVPTLGSANPE
ncbi:tRNA epoxyqueuosine(34) reductase QueG [Acidisoma cellulosilytica]|uniref:Epoxyqueuosine reductase n=1 Tax=Acidisoma cellulosilyticum TaxID=2802395 RepID=A0A963YZY8_9PROT|nr:tRNA epoxyqueuosine(34) reductase QueG [Acidisoma cellulosilyticum]MCB8879290.1 tRNA epoxyqueuosine(34) reductase QueG [Acidisoma cellulosilyticum]